MQQSVISVLTRFAAFLLTELIHASGVLSTVAAGLLISQIGPRLIPAAARVQAQSFWGCAPASSTAGCSSWSASSCSGPSRDCPSSVLRALGATLAAVVAVLGTRLLWFHTVPYVLRPIDRRPVQRTRRVPVAPPRAHGLGRLPRRRSLALGVPETAADGAPSPGRDLIVFITCGVILANLPRTVRWAKLPTDDALRPSATRPRRSPPAPPSRRSRSRPNGSASTLTWSPRWRPVPDARRSPRPRRR